MSDLTLALIALGVFVVLLVVGEIIFKCPPRNKMWHDDVENRGPR